MCLSCCCFQQHPASQLWHGCSFQLMGCCARVGTCKLHPHHRHFSPLFHNPATVLAQLPDVGELHWDRAAFSCTYTVAGGKGRGEKKGIGEVVTAQIQFAGTQSQSSSLWAGSCVHTAVGKWGLKEAAVELHSTQLPGPIVGAGKAPCS